jgi:hypothetical protein
MISTHPLTLILKTSKLFFIENFFSEIFCFNPTFGNLHHAMVKFAKSFGIISGKDGYFS